MPTKYDIIILGTGPAGLSAAVYAVRYGLRTLVIGKEPGGTVSETTTVENYLGFPSIKGAELCNRFTEHAKKAGAELMLYKDINSIKKSDGGFKVETEKDSFASNTLIIALGTEKRRLQIPGEKELSGKGVSYCATCDGPLFKGKDVAVVGGRNSAVTAALFLAETCKKVYIIYRRDKLRSDAVLTERVSKAKNIEVIYNSVPVKINGSQMVESLTIKRNGKEENLKLDGIFIEIGCVPSTDLASEDMKVKLDKQCRIDVKLSMETSVEGVFAAGDITNGSNGFDQIATAVAEGAIAANSAFKFLKKVKY